MSIPRILLEITEQEAMGDEGCDIDDVNSNVADLRTELEIEVRALCVRATKLSEERRESFEKDGDADMAYFDDDAVYLVEELEFPAGE